MNLGLLLLRLLIGGLFLARGTQRLYGWSKSMGTTDDTGRMAALGYDHPHQVATILAWVEGVCGGLLVLGLFTPLAAAGVVALMFHAAVAHGMVGRGLWTTNAGVEYPLVLSVVALAVTAMGPGAFSLDAVLAFPLSGWLWALAAAILGIGMSVALLHTRDGRAGVTNLTQRDDHEPRAA